MRWNADDTGTRVERFCGGENLTGKKRVRDTMSPDINERKSSSIGHGGSLTIIYSEKTSQTNGLNSSGLKSGYIKKKNKSSKKKIVFLSY